MFKVYNRNTKIRCEICSKLTVKTQKRRQWRRPGVFIVNFEYISHLVLVFLFLTLNRLMPVGMFKVNILDTGAILKICLKLTVKISEWYHRCSSGDCIVHFEQAQKQSFPNFQYNGCPEKFPKIHGKTFRSSPFLVKLFKKDFYLRNFPINFFFFFFFEIFQIFSRTPSSNNICPVSFSMTLNASRFASAIAHKYKIH